MKSEIPRPTGKEKWESLSEEEKQARREVSEFMNRAPGRVWSSEEVAMLIEAKMRGEELRIPGSTARPPSPVAAAPSVVPATVAPASIHHDMIPVSEVREREERIRTYHEADAQRYREEVAELQETIRSITKGEAKEDRELDTAIRRAQLALLEEQVRQAKSGVMEAGMIRVAVALEKLAESKQPAPSKKEG